MSWKEFLKGLKLAELQTSLKVMQVGVVNVENKTYNLHFSNPETVKAFTEVVLTPEAEFEIKEKTRERLESISTTLNCLLPAVSGEVVATTTMIEAIARRPTKKEGE